MNVLGATNGKIIIKFPPQTKQSHNTSEPSQGGCIGDFKVNTEFEADRDRGMYGLGDGLGVSKVGDNWSSS